MRPSPLPIVALLLNLVSTFGMDSMLWMFRRFRRRWVLPRLILGPFKNILLYWTQQVYGFNILQTWSLLNKIQSIGQSLTSCIRHLSSKSIQLKDLSAVLTFVPEQGTPLALRRNTTVKNRTIDDTGISVGICKNTFGANPAMWCVLKRSSINVNR